MNNTVVEINPINENLIVEREREIENIVQEISELFTDMALLVTQQGETINSIQDNIEASANNTEKAVIQLNKAKKYQSKYRVRSFYCFIIIFIILLIVIIIMISK
jgi:t-SNARE complex subunit (syntaxin)